MATLRRVSGDAQGRWFAPNGIVVEGAVLEQLRAWRARAARGAEQLQRLLVGEAVPAHDAAAGVSVTYTDLGHRHHGLVLLDCAAVSVSLVLLRAEQVAGLEEAGHPVHTEVATHFRELISGPPDAELVALRNVLVGSGPAHHRH